MILLTASVAGAQTTGTSGRRGSSSSARIDSCPSFPSPRTRSRTTTSTRSRPASTTGSSTLAALRRQLRFGSARGRPGGREDPTFYTSPRVGFDYVFLPNWTIGGDLFVFFTLGGSNTGSQGGNSGSRRHSPRATRSGSRRGSATSSDISALLSFWLRGGFSFYHAGTSEQGRQLQQRKRHDQLERLRARHRPAARHLAHAALRVPGGPGHRLRLRRRLRDEPPRGAQRLQLHHLDLGRVLVAPTSASPAG